MPPTGLGKGKDIGSTIGTTQSNYTPTKGDNGWITGMIPSLINFGSGLLQRHWAKKDLKEQNAYNSPQAQLGRLEDANLPAASFFSGGVSNQSEQPRQTELPKLDYQQTRLQQKQLLMLDAQIRATNADADQKQSYSRWLNEQSPNTLGPTNTNAGRLYDTKLATQEAQKAAADASQMIQQQIAASGENGMLTKLKEGQLDGLLKQNRMLEQVFQDNQLFMTFKRDFSERIKSRDASTSIMDILTDMIGILVLSISSNNK